MIKVKIKSRRNPIKTMHTMRRLYEKHLGNMEDYARMIEKGEHFDAEDCKFCEAAELYQIEFGERHKDGGLIDDNYCRFCPLEDGCVSHNSNIIKEDDGCDQLRYLSLRGRVGAGFLLEGNPCYDYSEATPKSIRKHIKLLGDIITKRTDCQIYTPVKKDD